MMGFVESVIIRLCCFLMFEAFFKLSASPQLEINDEFFLP